MAEAQPPAEGQQPPTPGDDDIPEPTAEELAGLSESGQRALRTERQHRREARETARQLKQQNEELTRRLADIEAKLNTPPASPAEPTAPAAPVPTPSAGNPVLTDCITFEAVDAAVMAATQMESKALMMNQTLLLEGVDAVAPMLANEGIQIEDGKLVNVANKAVLGEANQATIARLISNAFTGARAIQAQAAPRKEFLIKRATSWNEAVTKMPDLKNPKSETYQRIAHLLRTNPQLRDLANGPEVAVKLYLGEQAWTGKPLPTAAAPAKPPTPPTPASAPGAPRTSAAGTPKSSELDTLRAKMANGTATLAEVDRYTSLSIQANDNAR